MRGIESGLISILAIGLLAGLAVGVEPQDEVPDPAAWKTFEWRPAGEWESPFASGFSVEADDPRASGTMMVTTVGIAGGAADDDPVKGRSGSARLVNDEGAWTGFGGEFDGASDIGTVWSPLTALWKLTGEGVYDGLVIILVSGAFPDGPSSWGMIGPADATWWIPNRPGAG